MRRAYQTDLSDAEWSCLEPHLPAPKAHGRPRLHHLREILDAIVRLPRYALPPSGGELGATNRDKVCLAPLQGG